MKKVIFIAIVLAAALGGCLKDPFSTRNSQEPAGSTGTWETPATPDVVILNMLFAYNEKIIQNYQLCFADDYTFSATEDSIEAEARGNPSLFQFWDKAVEVATTQNLFATFAAENKHLDLIFSPSMDYADSLGDSLAVIYKDYIIRVVAYDSLSADTTYIEGTVSFSLSRTLFNWWSIYLWKELPVAGNEYDWADLKSEYRN